MRFSFLRNLLPKLRCILPKLRWLLQKLRWLLGRRIIKGIMVIMLMSYLVYRGYLHREAENQINRSATLSGWGREKPMSLDAYLDPKQNTATVVPKDLCKSKAFLVIAVCSFVNNFERRRTIRITWGNTTEFNYPAFVKLHGHLKGQYLDTLPERRRLYAEYLSGRGDSMTASVRIVFVVGRKSLSLGENEAVAREALEYNDIIQENFMDTYNNLTIKTILALKHISQNCANTTAFVFKCDDDSFVNVPNLLHFLLGGTIPLYNSTVRYHYRDTCQVMERRNRLTARSRVLYGHQLCNVQPISDRGNKWYVPAYMFRGEVFPQYLCGSGYVMSIDVAPLLYKKALGTKLMHLEDIFITGMCAEKAGIKRFDQPLCISFYSDDMCSFKGTITMHHAKGWFMWQAWYFVSNYSIQCPPPEKGFEEDLPQQQIC